MNMNMKRFPGRRPRKLGGAQRGFTLVELVMTMGLMSIFLVVITDVVSTTLDVRTESEAISAASEDGRFILGRLDYDLQRASSVSTPAALGGSGATLAIVISGVTNTYALSGGNLQLANLTGTNNLNSNGTTVSGLTFQRLGNSGGKDTVRVTFTLTSVARADFGQETRTFNTTLGRRQ